MYSRILEARAAGAVHVDLEGYDSDITVVVDDGCRRAQVEAYADVNSGSTVEEIDKLSLRESGGSVELHLPESASGGTMVMNSFSDGGYSSVQIGSVGRGMSVIGNQVFTGGGDSDMVVNGQRIQVRGGKTYVNGVPVDGGPAQPVGDPPATIHLRATVPPGSTVRVKTYNGNILSTGAGQVDLKSYNGNIYATGLSEDSKVKTYNGDISVGATPGSRPEVKAETYNGDIRVLDDDIRVRPKTYNGDVRHPR